MHTYGGAKSSHYEMNVFAYRVTQSSIDTVALKCVNAYVAFSASQGTYCSTVWNSFTLFN